MINCFSLLQFFDKAHLGTKEWRRGRRSHQIFFSIRRQFSIIKSKIMNITRLFTTSLLLLILAIHGRSQKNLSAQIQNFIQRLYWSGGHFERDKKGRVVIARTIILTKLRNYPEPAIRQSLCLWIDRGEKPHTYPYSPIAIFVFFTSRWFYNIIKPMLITGRQYDAASPSRLFL